jgi:hypothetical protein
MKEGVIARCAHVNGHTGLVRPQSRKKGVKRSQKPVKNPQRSAVAAKSKLFGKFFCGYLPK